MVKRPKVRAARESPVAGKFTLVARSRYVRTQCHAAPQGQYGPGVRPDAGNRRPARAAQAERLQGRDHVPRRRPRRSGRDQFVDRKENADTYSRDTYREVLKSLAKVVEGTPKEIGRASCRE